MSQGTERVTDPTARAGLDPAQLAELLTILPDMDSVELKLAVDDAQRRSVIAALGLDPVGAQIREIVFVDTLDLDLLAAGVILRGRRSIDRADVVVKLRPVDLRTVPEHIHGLKRFKVEVDVSPQGFSASCSLRAKVSGDQVQALVTGGHSITDLFDAHQQELLRPRVADLDLSRLVPLGPVPVLKRVIEPKGLGHRLVAEMWFLPDGRRALELSTRCTPAEAFMVAAETKAFLGTNGVDLAAPQAPKTRTALDALVADHRAGDAAAAGQ
ncbi:hypothetical protein CLV56_3841 [Mumia flava]|uniref:Uncharacterized protein n=1 Tax=Mumia flava TaxID=1348852 RepID=A0A2M9B8Q1_9ACTN|nr:adenylate cyclase [Mumia flava]PJJ54332.1 hypothetical protein CLV56_3841 [Mumia flava]